MSIEVSNSNRGTTVALLIIECPLSSLSSYAERYHPAGPGIPGLLFQLLKRQEDHKFKSSLSISKIKSFFFLKIQDE